MAFERGCQVYLQSFDKTFRFDEGANLVTSESEVKQWWNTSYSFIALLTGVPVGAIDADIHINTLQLYALANTARLAIEGRLKSFH